MFLPDVFGHLKQLKKSPRGEYEITDVLTWYVSQGLLTYSILKSAWTDAGSFDSLYKATVLMRQLELKANFKMNILVTGANGFIGRRLSSRLINGPKGPSRPLLLSQDISKPFFIKRPFDFVIHLAAYNITNVGAKDAGLYTAVNVEGTRTFITSCSYERFIYLSTTKVYKNEGLPITEDSPLDPQGAYEQSKLKAEEVCRDHFKKESLVILRSVNVMGWGQAPKAVLPVFFQKAKANQPLDIINSPIPRCSLCMWKI